MMRTLVAIALAGITFMAVSGTSRAAPIAPLPEALVANSDGVAQAHYYYPGHRCHYWRGHHCYYHQHGHNHWHHHHYH